MHNRKREYEPKKEKRDDNPVCKTINCVNCGKIIAQGNIQHGKIEIVCQNCGTRNKMEATPKDAATETKVMSDIYAGRRVRAAFA